MSNDFPKPVVEEKEYMEDAFDGLATISTTQSAPRTWIVAASSVRVYVDAPYRRSHDGKWKPKKGTVIVDGQHRPVIDDIGRAIQLFIGHPDPNASDAGETLEPVGHERNPQDAPPEVQQQVRALTAKLGCHPRVGIDTHNYWVIELIAEDRRTGIRFAFDQTAHARRWAMRPIEVIVNGVDRSAEVSDNLAHAISLMSGLSGPGGSSTPPASTGGPKQGAANNAVTTRRTTVIQQ